MVDWEKQEEMKKVLQAAYKSTGLGIYKEIEVEITRLWSLKKDVKNLFSGFPVTGQHYLGKKLEDEIQSRLILTNKILNEVQ